MKPETAWYLDTFYDYCSKGLAPKKAYISTENDYEIQTGKRKYKNFHSFSVSKVKFQKKLFKKSK